MINYNSIAFLPIDLPKIVLDEESIKSAVNNHNTLHHGGIWKCLPLMGAAANQNTFNNPEEFDQVWKNRYNPKFPTIVNLKYYESFKLVIDHLFKLPLVITHAQILNQTRDIGKHFDLKHNDDASIFYDDTNNSNYNNEPACYKVLLNNFSKKSLYVSKGFGWPNDYIKLPEDTCTFVISEKNFPHGATNTDTPKYIISIFGIIDKQNHLNLLEKSYKKYKDYAILY